MPDARMTVMQMLDVGWKVSLSPNPTDFIIARDGPGKYSYVGHHGACYIEGTAASWADLERAFHARHHTALRNGVIQIHV